MIDEICPALTELREPFSPDVRRHLAGCRRCKVLVRHLGIDQDPGATIADAGGLVQYRTAPEVSLGDICAAVAPGLHQRFLCVITDAEAGVIEVVPISDESQFACDRDLLLVSDLLGYETMAETWNMGSLLVDDIAEVLAQLDDDTYEQLANLIEAAEEGREADGIEVGPSIVYDTDARHDFQQREAQRVRPFFASSSALRSASRLPELITRAAEESGTSVTVLSQRYGPLVQHRPHWVEDLIAERIGVRDVPGRTIGALLAEFELRPSERLAAIVRCTGWVDDYHETSSATALIGSEHDDESDSDVDEYISEVFAGLVEALASRTPSVD
jgi:hypothetical protein